MRVYPPQTVAVRLTAIRRERMLPVPGEVVVQQGARVEPVDVVARADVPAGFRILNVARSLGIPASSAGKTLRVKPGDRVKRGQVVAVRRGLLRRTCRSPIEGIVTGVGGGRLLIEAPPSEVEVRANLYGFVAEVIPQWGVVIQTNGAWIQGIWGNGREGTGILRVLTDEPEALVTVKQIDASCHGMVLVGGRLSDVEVLERAAEIQVRGVVCGSLSPAVLSAAMRVPFPVMTTEGIGEVPMCEPIYNLLSGNAGREAMVDAQFQTRWEVARPEVIVPLPAAPDRERLPDPAIALRLGDRVRAVRSPHKGAVGTVEAFPVWVETGAGSRLPGARVRVDGREDPLMVPLINLEVLR